MPLYRALRKKWRMIMDSVYAEGLCALKPTGLGAMVRGDL